MTGLKAIIADLIKKSGHLSLSSYMELALQHPVYGYYVAGEPVGAKGDFITAPEVSQMFGELIGLWLAEVWTLLGRPESFALLELGPGRGTLLSDALRATAKIKGFHSALHLCLIESNAHYREQQKERLVDFRPHHIDDISLLPALPTLIISNEFLDALPIRQFEKGQDAWHERVIIIEDDELKVALSRPDPTFRYFVPPNLEASPPKTVVEVSISQLNLLRDIARHIGQNKGAALFVDYGYSEPSGRETLQALSHHSHVDFLADPGGSDLTSHVNFAALKEVALKNNARVSGPMGQGEFLTSLGIEMRAKQLEHLANKDQVKGIEQALFRLIDPSQMGTLFKVMAITSNDLLAVPGF